MEDGGRQATAKEDPTTSAALFQDLFYLFGIKRMLVDCPPPSDVGSLPLGQWPADREPAGSELVG